MPRTLLTLHQVAQALHLSTREITRMADENILPGIKVRGHWEFRAAEIRDWIDQNLHVLPTRRAKDRHPEVPGDLLLDAAIKAEGIRVDGAAKTRASVLRELAELAAAVDTHIDASALATALSQREEQGSTALGGGVAVPHPSRPVYLESPLIAILRTSRPIPFGERGGGMTDLFFLVCCPDHTGHLLHLGRLCKLLVDGKLLTRIREAPDSQALRNLIVQAEETLCMGK
jgi:PTS system nitrogen regulatory IIA component